MTRDGQFVPKWASPPGETIRDLLNARDLSAAVLAAKMGVSAERVESLLAGDEHISIDLARRLVEAVGGTVPFWLARDGQYHDDLARLAAAEWTQTVPIPDLMTLGWIPERPTTWLDRIGTSLGFFGVPSLEAWRARYGLVVANAQFRMIATASTNPTAVAAWLRRAELEAQPGTLALWDPIGFNASLAQARRLTTDRDPARFVPELIALCASRGVSLVVLRTPAGCPASGAVRYLDDHPQIVLSARYRTDDHFWFSFFHEAAHLVLHDSRSVFIDEFVQAPQGLISDREQQADEFAAELLIPGAVRTEFDRLSGEPRDLIAFARRIGISPGLIVGQLQHSGRLAWASRLNGLKRRYTWRGATLERA